jgi:hypothetical protein
MYINIRWCKNTIIKLKEINHIKPSLETSGVTISSYPPGGMIILNILGLKKPIKTQPNACTPPVPEKISKTSPIINANQIVLIGDRETGSIKIKII